MVIDSLGLSWYLNTGRKIHGLSSFLEDYGIQKPSIEEDDWAGISKEDEEILNYYEEGGGYVE
jgi:hypothetical protein